MPWSFQSIRVSLKRLYKDLLKLYDLNISSNITLLVPLCALYSLCALASHSLRVPLKLFLSLSSGLRAPFKFIRCSRSCPGSICDSFVCPSVLYVRAAPLPCGVPLRILVCAPSPPKMCPSISLCVPLNLFLCPSGFSCLLKLLCEPLMLCVRSS